MDEQKLKEITKLLKETDEYIRIATELIGKERLKASEPKITLEPIE